MASTEGRLLYVPKKAVIALDPIPFSGLGSALRSFYSERSIELEDSEREIKIAMDAGGEVLHLVQAGGAFTQLGVVSPWTYDAIYSSLSPQERKELDREGHIQLRPAYVRDSLGIQDPGKPEGLGRNELIHVISPSFSKRLKVVRGQTGFGFQYREEVVKPYTQDYFSLQGKLRSAIQGLANLAERNMFSSRITRRLAFTVPHISTNTIVRSVLLEVMANS